MRIGYVLQDPERSPTGLDTYTSNLWDALMSAKGGHELVPVVLPRQIAGRAYLRALWEQVYLPLWAHRHRIDLLHVPAGSAPVLRTRPCVLTLHDLGEEVTPGYRTPLGPRLYFRGLVPWSARFATALMSDSAATKREAVARLGIPEERITVVPLAAAPWFKEESPEAVAETRHKYGLPDPYFLQMGARIPRKNLRGCLIAFARLMKGKDDRELQLAVAGGRGFGDRSLPPEIEELVRRGRVRFLGHVPQEDLPALYTGALAVVQPSFYEGFGFPLVEAFACGTPAIASRVASLPEVGGEAALYVDPHDPTTIASAMERIATSPHVRRDMAGRASERRHRFSWRKTAEQTLKVYGRALQQGRAKSNLTPVEAPPDSGNGSGPKVLFVRLDSLGDVILTTPCFQALKRRYPAARVDVVAQPATAPVLQGDRHVDRVFTMAAPWHGPWRPGAARRVWQVMRRLRRERYDYVLTLRRDLDDALFARLCGGRRTLGFYARRTRPFLSGWEHFQPDRHTVENHLRLMSRLGCEPDGLTPTVFATSGDPKRIDSLLAHAAHQRPLVGLAPFGSSASKSWETSRSAALIDSLPRMDVVLLGGPGDREEARAVRNRACAPVIDLVGQTSIPELCDILRQCRLLVCVDSGPMHLAAALGTPTVALFGDEDPRLWGPYGQVPHRVLRGGNGSGRASPQGISVGMALKAVHELIEATRAASSHSVAQVEVTS